MPTTVEKFPCPDALEARVIEPGDDPRIHGFALGADLLQHYDFVEILWLSLVGELPTTRQRDLLSMAMSVLVADDVSQDSVHVGVLARIYARGSDAVLATAAPVVTARVAYTLEQQGALFAWLDDGDGTPPASALGEGTVAAWARTALEARGEQVEGLEHPLHRTALGVVLLYRAGITGPDQQQIVMSMVGLLAPAVEAMARPRGRFHKYPMRLPKFVTVDP